MPSTCDTSETNKLNIHALGVGNGNERNGGGNAHCAENCKTQTTRVLSTVGEGQSLTTSHYQTITTGYSYRSRKRGILPGGLLRKAPPQELRVLRLHIAKRVDGLSLETLRLQMGENLLNLCARRRLNELVNGLANLVARGGSISSTRNCGCLKRASQGSGAVDNGTDSLHGS